MTSSLAGCSNKTLFFFFFFFGVLTCPNYASSQRSGNVAGGLDYHFVNEEAAGRIAEAGIDAEVQGSDHCPVGIVLR